MWHKKLLLVVSIFIFHLFAISFPAFAAEEFSTSYDVTYDVQANGITDVTQKISLKNLTSQYYVSNFTLSIGSNQILDIIASDEGGGMETKVEEKDGRTSITVKFNGQVAGLGKTQSFTLKFKSRDFAQALGKTWEVNLPKIPSSGRIESYNLVLSVPVSFGDPTSISPQPKSESSSFDRLFFNYDKSQLEKSGVSVNFGTTQIFDFNIKYPLENRSLFPALTSITLPPDTKYQDIALTKIDPKPENIVIDADGNYLAWYRLKRGDKFEVEVAGSAKLYINRKDSSSAYKTPQPLSSEQISIYTQADRYWEKDSPAIAATLQQIYQGGDYKSKREKVRAIYLYVVNTLRYDLKRLENPDIERLGALTALNNPTTAVCMEFTDLFISLARAAGIPARELDGFAYTQNQTLRPLSLSKDLLHSWPEYWDDEKGWVMVDPTWENTSGGVDYFNKFDLNHFVLAVKGSSSQSPYVSDQVKVSLSQTDFIPKSQLEVEIKSPELIWSPLPVGVDILVTNSGSSLQSPANLNIYTDKLLVKDQTEFSLGSIPAHGYTKVSIELRAPLFGERFEDQIEVMVGGVKTSKNIQVQPILSNNSYPYLILGSIFLGGSIYSSVLLLHYLKRKMLYRRNSR